MITMIDKINYVYHIERGWVALGGRSFVGLLFCGFGEGWCARGKIRKERK
jgi:hypothetical protein